MKRFRIFALALCLVFVFGLFSGCSKDEYADPEGRFLKPKKLSAKLEQKIKEDYTYFLNENYPDIVFFTYLGTYNDYMAVFPYPSPGGDDALTRQTMAGYPYTGGDSGAVIYLYKDGTFVEGDEAYKKGMITKQDAEAITWLYNNDQGLFYKANNQK